MNNPNTLQLTEADVLTYLRDVTDFYAPQFPEVRELRATINLLSDQVSFYGYIDENYNSIIGYGKTFAAAALDLREKIGTPTTRAAQLREQAAALIIEAQKLEGAQ